MGSRTADSHPSALGREPSPRDLHHSDAQSIARRAMLCQARFPNFLRGDQASGDKLAVKAAAGTPEPDATITAGDASYSHWLSPGTGDAPPL